jgi:hypothetical protein
MATPKHALMATEKPFPAQAATGSLDPAGFGAYGTGAGMRPDLKMALDKPLDSQLKGSTDFTENDRRWLKELGITVTDPVDFKRIWSPKFEQHWQTRKWSESYTGRLAMRSVSRFVVGSAFYAVAQTYGTSAMGKKITQDGIRPAYTNNGEAHNLLQHVARFIDNTAGKTIQFAVKNLPGGSEEKALKATMFRDTIDFGYKTAHDATVMGRSLGHEILAVTFDFASMSFGDYMTRYVVGLFDPNARSQWLQDGHISPTKALQDVFKNVFRGITYAAGEDMAVALPYVYYMKGQRHLIDKASPGFKYDFDGGNNGGSFKINSENKVVGNYQLEGMIDLMGRFSWYNVGTKMFRDGYNIAEEKISDWWQGGHKVEIHAPKEVSAKGVFQVAKDSVRYVARTTIKTMLYMIPSTFFFYSTRSPQSKIRGLAIDPERGILVREQHANGNGNGISNGNGNGRDNFGGTEWVSSDSRFKPVKPGSDIHPDDRLFFRDDKHNTPVEGHIRVEKWVPNPFTNDNHEDAFRNTYYEKHGTKAPWHDKVTNPLAKLSYSMGSAYNRMLSPLTKHYYKSRIGAEQLTKPAEKRMSPEDFQHTVAEKSEIFARRYANAAISYTPYFMMKSDVLSAFLDTKRTDMALDRTLHGAAHLKWGEFKAGISEVFRAVRKEPFTDPKREVMAEEGMAYDTEKFSNEAYQLGYTGYVHGKNKGRLTGQKVFATDDLKVQRPTYTTLTPSPTGEDTWKKLLTPEALDDRKQKDEKEKWQQILSPEALEERRRIDAGQGVNWSARQEAARKFSEEHTLQGHSVH